MSKSLSPYWNALREPAAWTPVPGLEGQVEFCTLSLCEHSGEYTRLTRFAPGTRTETVAVHDYPEEVFIVSGRLFDAAVQRWLETGDYASRPPGERHGPFHTEEGCVVLELSFPQRAARASR
jgi:ChrR Cupin-like domain